MFHIAIVWYITILELQTYVCVGSYYTLVNKIIYCSKYVKWLSVQYGMYHVKKF